MTDFNYYNPQNSVQDDKSKYFADREASATASVLLAKGQSFFNILYTNYYLDKLRRMWYAYHGIYRGDEHKINFTGEEGELVSMPVNHFRNIGSHIIQMIAANRATMEAKAINTDYKSLSQTYLANGILDYYMREKGLEECLRRAVELSVVLGAGYVKLAWNSTSGDAYDVDPETGEFAYHGDLEFTNLTPFDVVMDGTRESWDNEWLLVRTFKNKFNLVAKFPELGDKIKGIDTKQFNSIYRVSAFTNDDTDDIPVYEFYHKKTEAMPDGRYMLFVTPEIVLIDTKMPYANIPIYRIVPSEILGTPYGYSPLFDLYPIQEAINSLHSTIMTNNNAFGVQNIYVPRGADISYSSLEGGLNIIEANAKPEPIQLTATAPETFNYLQTLIREMETISGINSVSRGNPESSLKSGAALALVQSMAIQFISGLQQSYVRLIESVGTSVVQMLKDFAHTPRLVAIVGKNNRPFLKEFTGDDISSICRVIVEVGNPLAKTTAGRVQMAEQLAQMNLLKNPEQYFQIINTGKLDVAFEGEMNDLLSIKSENEKILEGQAVPVSIFDKHKMHIMEHRTLISDPELRFNPQLLQAAHKHIEDHLQQLREGDPEILMLMGEQPLQSNQQQAPGQPGQPRQPMGNDHILQGSVMSDVQGAIDAAPQIQTGEQMGMQSLPQPAKPAGQFRNLPTNPADLPQQ